MPGNGDTGTGRVVLLFTRFPVLSETFLQREVACFREANLDMELVSLWGGDRDWNGLLVERNDPVAASLGLFWLLYWLVRKPRAAAALAGAVFLPRHSGLLNWLENLLGLGYALRTANRWQRAGIRHFHAVWASAPAAAAWGLHRLTGIPFSFGGHAYDLFERGGDGWMPEKIRSCDWVRTSTRAGRDRFRELGAPPESILLVRRGLTDWPEVRVDRPLHDPLRFLAVGRMVGKMGFDRQIPLFADLARRKLRFTVTWIGDGPERGKLERMVAEAGLGGAVTFRGACPYAEVEAAYPEHDVFLFTGRVDRRGDRAGLPNAVAEAMAHALPVFATPVGAVGEAVEDGRNGFLWPGEPEASLVLKALEDPRNLEACRLAARHWALEHYDLRENLAPLLQKFGNAGVRLDLP